jgi:hypothetical protein
MNKSTQRPNQIHSFGRFHAFRGRLLFSLIAALAIVTAGTVGSAQDGSKTEMQSLDEQVQEIKSDVLAIAAELNNLEEKLLYPSNSQVAVFVSIEDDDALGLDSVQISIDGELVAHHIYSFKELQALQKGGVQRIYTGNVRTGTHQLDVAIAAGGEPIEQRQSFSFDKEVDPKLVGITLASQVTGDAKISVGSW